MVQRSQLGRSPSRCGGALAVFLALSWLGGCSDGEISGLQRVSGTVTYQGKPVEGAIISFIGQGETRPATAVSQADGSYELFTLDSRGAQPGSYVVVVTKTQLPTGSAADQPDPGFDAAGVDLSMQQAAKMEGKPPPKAIDLLPTKYSSPATSPLRCEVKDSESNIIDLKLE